MTYLTYPTVVQVRLGASTTYLYHLVTYLTYLVCFEDQPGQVSKVRHRVVQVRLMASKMVPYHSVTYLTYPTVVQVRLGASTTYLYHSVTYLTYLDWLNLEKIAQWTWGACSARDINFSQSPYLPNRVRQRPLFCHSLKLRHFTLKI